MDQKLRESLARISVATVTMQLLKRGIRQVSLAGVLPLNDPVLPIVGPAYTLRFVPMREDLSSPEVLGDPDYEPRRAIEMCPVGSVLVIDGRGRGDIAVLGDLLVERLRVRGVEAVVSDGGVRDFDETLAVGLPIYAAGRAAPAHLAGHSAADRQITIACGGVSIVPGDIIVGDGDGVAVIPQALATEVARDGLEQERYERFAKLKIQGGRAIAGVYPPSQETRAEYQKWVDAGEPGE
jgi:regulator of RNase E activity RraA